MIDYSLTKIFTLVKLESPLEKIKRIGDQLDIEIQRGKPSHIWYRGKWVKL